jgi:hypothetical protein
MAMTRGAALAAVSLFALACAQALRPYVLRVKAAHPRRKLRSGVASEWPKPSPKLSEDEPWISIADFSSVWTSRN